MLMLRMILDAGPGERNAKTAIPNQNRTTTIWAARGHIIFPACMRHIRCLDNGHIVLIGTNLYACAQQYHLGANG
jgi:hypothetical protein